MAIKMMRKCKKKEEITMKKQKDGLAKRKVIFLLFILPQAEDYWAEINFSYFSFQGAITDTFLPSRV